MNKIVISFLSVLFLASICAGAQDKLTTVNGDVFDVKVFEVNKDIVRIDRLRTEYTDIKYFASKYVKSITFRDGFCVEFNADGIPSRDNFLNAPTMKCRTNGIYAEGLFRLTEDETMNLLGPEKYCSMYKPAKSTFYTGIAQLFTGGSVLTASAMFDKKDVLIQNRKRGIKFKGLELLGSLGLENVHNVRHFSGNLNPYFVSAEIFGATTLVFGFVNFLSARSTLKSAIVSELPAFSLDASQRRYWAGIGMTVVGAGSIVAGTIDIAHKSKWDWNEWDDPSFERYNVKEGTPPIAGPILALAGSVLINLGIHEFIQSGVRIKYIKKVHTGITQNGAGLCLDF